MLTNSNSSEGDQLAFLQLGLDMREYGILTDGTRNPLYAAFLALIAHRDWDYFTYAKFLSMGFGILAIIAVYLLGRRSFNAFTGLAAAYLLSINVEFIVHRATALKESQLMLNYVLAWLDLI
jgi:asparagine N-glycosylation enzyme membrane subunit Stt3